MGRAKKIDVANDGYRCLAIEHDLAAFGAANLVAAPLGDGLGGDAKRHARGRGRQGAGAGLVVHHPLAQHTGLCFG